MSGKKKGEGGKQEGADMKSLANALKKSKALITGA